MSVCQNCGATLTSFDVVLQINDGYPREYVHTQCPPRATYIEKRLDEVVEDLQNHPQPPTEWPL